MWDEEQVNSALERIMKKAFEEVWSSAEENHTTLRMGAYMVAIGRIAEAKKIRAVFP